MRPPLIPAALIFVSIAAPPPLQPQTYSFTQDPAFPIAGPAVVKITRDGSKEVVEQTMPAGFAGREKEYHGRLLYDFQAHKIYTQVLSDPGSPCSLQDYTDPAAPSLFDPISGAADLLKELAGDAPLKQVGTETINGIPSKVMQATSPKSNGKIWISQSGGFPVKIVGIEPDGKVTTLIEVKQLSFAKPPASVFTPPAGCVAVALPTQSAPPKPTTNISAVTLQPTPNYSGACPAHLTLTGTITSDGPGKVFYQFGVGAMEPGEIITFNAAETKTVSHAVTLQPKYGNDMGVYPILVAIGADDSGNHAIPTKSANNAGFKITCTSGGGQ
jgi:hypothetical protein